MRLYYAKLREKYVMLPEREYASYDEVAYKDLRPYTLDYIKTIKTEGFDHSSAFAVWILANLEAMGKVKSAERIYVYMLGKGWIKGL